MISIKKEVAIRRVLNTDWFKFLLYLAIAHLYRVQSLAFVNIFFRILYFTNLKAVIIFNFIYWHLSKIDLTERPFIWVVHKNFFFNCVLYKKLYFIFWFTLIIAIYFRMAVRLYRCYFNQRLQAGVVSNPH